MDSINKKIILASKSPRRIELLRKAGFDVEVIPANIKEVIESGLAPDQVVMNLAYQKASSVRKQLLGKSENFSFDGLPILAADTVVYLDEIIGKPADRKDAEKILMRLSGKMHQVYTGGSILKFSCSAEPSSEILFSERTNVFFKKYTAADISDYLDTNEPYDKAGAYAIQGYFGKFIDHIDGNYDNVMGLPTDKVIGALKSLCLS